MSEPDAVPLPREGEVFFDVRGEARSMRLSWYADSRVAVFSIWQANRCTGTFRLPFADLARMVHTLQSGPRPQAEPQAVPEYGGTPSMTGAYAASPVYNGYPQEVAHGHGYGRDAVYPQPPREPAHPLADYDPPNYQDVPAYQDAPAPQDAGYGPGTVEPGGYDRIGYDSNGYDRTGYERTGEYRAPQDHAGYRHERDRHERDGYERESYGTAAPGHWRPEPGQWPAESGHGYGGPDVTLADHDLPNFPSVPARTGQSAADWALP